MKEIFNFWEKVDWYDIRVLNERELRAWAWILFLFAIISFMNAWLLWNFYYTKIFITIFLIDFVIRVLINPKFSPSLILWKIIVQNQKPEYVWAIQKRFAWWIWLLLAIIIFLRLVIYNIIGPLNMILCVTCLTLLFFESVFWICLWCKIYNLFSKNKAQLCPGWSCEIEKKEKIQNVSIYQIVVLILFFIFTYFSFWFVSSWNTEKNIESGKNTNNIIIKDNDPNCVVPEWAIKIWHKEMWKLHHWCK